MSAENGAEHVRELCEKTGLTPEQAWRLIEALPYSTIPEADDVEHLIDLLREMGWKRVG